MSTTRKYGGTGLGLSLVKELVEAHHGRVGLWSVAGSGTTVFVVLPVEQFDSDQMADKKHPTKPLRKEELVAGVLARHADELCNLKSPSNRFSRSHQPPPLVEAAAAEVSSPEAPGKWKHHSELYGTFEILSVDDNVVRQQCPLSSALISLLSDGGWRGWQINHVVIENSLTPKGHTVSHEPGC